ncbi:MAG: hypothetical protein HC915_13665 [Anaerolineae bacterium]|nr:hypothetical protein [Anaerolineae bacterium]
MAWLNVALGLGWLVGQRWRRMIVWAGLELFVILVYIPWLLTQSPSGTLLNTPPLPGLDPYLELQAPNGQIVAENDRWRPEIPDAYIRHTFDVTGVYIVYLSSLNPSSTGGYVLSVSDGFTLRDVPRGRLVLNVSSQGRLETYGARNIWQLEVADVNEPIQIDVEALDPSRFDVMAELVAPDGDVWFDNDSGEATNARLSNLLLDQPGLYRLNIAANNNASIGAYRIIWRLARDLFTPTPSLTPTPRPTFTPTPPTPAPPSGTFAGEVAPGASFEVFVAANAGNDLNIVVLGLEGFDPVLRVFDPANTLLLEVDDVSNSTDPRTRLTVAQSGLHRLEVRGYDGSGGRFTLNYIVR